MLEKSDLMEKWPLDTKEEHKRTTGNYPENLNILSNLPTGFRKILIYQVFCLVNLNKNLDGSVLVVLPFMNSIIKKQVRNWLSLAFLQSIWRRTIHSVWQPFHNGSFALFFFWLGVSVEGISNFLKSELLHWKLTPTSSFSSEKSKLCGFVSSPSFMVDVKCQLVRQNLTIPSTLAYLRHCTTSAPKEQGICLCLCEEFQFEV